VLAGRVWGDAVRTPDEVKKKTIGWEAWRFSTIAEKTLTVATDAVYIGRMNDGGVTIYRTIQHHNGDLPTVSIALTREQAEKVRDWLNEH
jgi:hypothetical protein